MRGDGVNRGEGGGKEHGAVQKKIALLFINQLQLKLTGKCNVN